MWFILSIIFFFQVPVTQAETKLKSENLTLNCDENFHICNSYEKLANRTRRDKNTFMIRGIKIAKERSTNDVRTFVHHFAEILAKQSSLENSDWKENADLLYSYLENENMVCELCEKVVSMPVISYLHVQRRQMKKKDPKKIEFTIMDFQPTANFRVTFNQTNIMNYISTEIYNISAVQENGNWVIKKFNINGSCIHSRTIKKKLIFQAIAAKSEKPKTNKTSEEFMNEITKLIPFSFNFDKNRGIFDQKFEAIIDSNLEFENASDYKYNLEDFQKYMQDFSQRFRRRRDIRENVGGNAETQIILKQTDHLVFRTNVIFEYRHIPVLSSHFMDLWEFTIEINLKNEKDWKVSRVFVRPPMRNFLNIYNMQSRQLFELMNNMEKKIEQNLGEMRKNNQIEKVEQTPECNNKTVTTSVDGYNFMPLLKTLKASEKHWQVYNVKHLLEVAPNPKFRIRYYFEGSSGGELHFIDTIFYAVYQPKSDTYYVNEFEILCPQKYAF
ncbi:unnamed protein product [Caenorhabditis angaria]|uniref:DUF38 domain-containing protein n=1 Tax=Caenorhabditis angaria TaxID=860376 RepID=A0A9P1I6X5_9PELO|nr:unnamed protein product [Caenorhabditis angaria]